MANSSSSYLERGEECVREGNRKLKSWTYSNFYKLFFYDPDHCHSKYHYARDDFQDAANFFKLAKSWDKAAEAYLMQANCLHKLRSDLSVAYANAGHCYQRLSVVDEAIKFLSKAVHESLKIEYLSRAARYETEIAQLYENEYKFEAASLHFQKAAHIHKQEDDMYNANTCNRRAAQSCIRLKQYQKASDMFEEIARVGKKVLKNVVTEDLFTAGIFQLCRDDKVAITEALERYQKLDPEFSGTIEYEFLRNVAAAVHEEDAAKFSRAVKKFNRLSYGEPRTKELVLMIEEALMPRLIGGNL